jgi:hypothetical protein
MNSDINLDNIEKERTYNEVLSDILRRMEARGQLYHEVGGVKWVISSLSDPMEIKALCHYKSWAREDSGIEKKLETFGLNKGESEVVTKEINRRINMQEREK